MISTLTDENDVKIMKRILKNIIDHPNDPKYRFVTVKFVVFPFVNDHI